MSTTDLPLRANVGQIHLRSSDFAKNTKRTNAKAVSVVNNYCFFTLFLNGAPLLDRPMKKWHETKLDLRNQLTMHH